MKTEQKLTIAVIAAIVTNLTWGGVAWYLYKSRLGVEDRLEQAQADFLKERESLATQYEKFRKDHAKQMEELETHLSRMAEYPTAMIEQIAGIRDQLKKGAEADSFTIETLRLVAGRLRSIEEGYAGPLREIEGLKGIYAGKLGAKPEAPKGWIFASIFRRGEINAYNRKLGQREMVGEIVGDLDAAYKRAQKSVSAHRADLRDATKQLMSLSDLNQESSYKAVEFCEVANRMLEAHRRFVESEAYKKARDIPSRPAP
jgi:hypothetical protein